MGHACNLRMSGVNVHGDSGVTIARPIIIMALALNIARRIAKFRRVHITAAWIGNSVAVAVKHYLQVTEDHFKQASKKRRKIRRIACT